MEPSVSVSNLTKNYAGEHALAGISFAVPRGCLFGMVGADGAGKTTLIRMLMNLTEPSAGQALLLGLDSRRHHTELMARVGYVAEVPMLYDWMTVRELARFT